MTAPSEWDKQEEEAGWPCPFPLLLHVPQPITPSLPPCWYRVQPQFTIRLIWYDEHFPLPKSESARSGMKLPILRSAALQKSSGLQDAAAVQCQQLGVAGKATGVAARGWAVANRISQVSKWKMALPVREVIEPCFLDGARAWDRWHTHSVHGTLPTQQPETSSRRSPNMHLTDSFIQDVSLRR